MLYEAITTAHDARIQQLGEKVIADISNVSKSFKWLEQHTAEMDRKRETTFWDDLLSLLLLGNVGLSIYNTVQDGKQLITAVQDQAAHQHLLEALRTRPRLLPLPVPAAKKTLAGKSRGKTRRRGGSNQRQMYWNNLAAYLEQQKANGE